jgi:hypothetical protein
MAMTYDPVPGSRAGNDKLSITSNTMFAANSTRHSVVILGISRYTAFDWVKYSFGIVAYRG